MSGNVFESKKKELEKWLDKLIKSFQAVSDAGKCSVEDIETCGTAWNREVHIYKGFDTLAFYLRATVIYDPNWTKKYPDTGICYFIYKGYKVMQLWEKKEVI